MKYLVVGLGNPGKEYEETRHNIGFKVVDEMARELGATFTLDKAAFRAEAKFKGRTIILIKPITFMNLSGKAVNYWCQQLKIEKERLLILTDDIALPYGKMRLKTKGSHGGHNGLRNIEELLGTQQYSRLRIGVGSDFSKGRQADYVLGNFTESETAFLPEHLDRASEIVLSFCTQGVNQTMNKYNQ